MKNPPDRKDCVGTKQAAEHIGITEPTLRKWRWLGKGPAFIKIGTARRGKVLYRIVDLDEFKKTLWNHSAQNKKGGTTHG